MITLILNSDFCGTSLRSLREPNNWDYLFIVSVVILYIGIAYYSLYALKLITSKLKKYFK